MGWCWNPGVSDEPEVNVTPVQTSTVGSARDKVCLKEALAASAPNKAASEQFLRQQGRNHRPTRTHPQHNRWHRKELQEVRVGKGQDSSEGFMMHVRLGFICEGGQDLGKQMGRKFPAGGYIQTKISMQKRRYTCGFLPWGLMGQAWN